MQLRSHGEKGTRCIAVTLEPGEEVIRALAEVAGTSAILGASLEAIGAVRDVVLGWFDVGTGRYATRTFEGPLELVSLQGTLARTDEGPRVHAHAACADRDLSLVGGHLVEAVCAVTVEIVLHETGFPLHRKTDGRFGLQLLDLLHGVADGADRP